MTGNLCYEIYSDDANLLLQNGGTWTAHLPDGLTRTISWHAGDSFVAVTDTTRKGTTKAQVPLRHELPLVPFK